LFQNLREISQRWIATVGGSVGLSTINEHIHQIIPLVAQAHREPISDVPGVVQLDGIWLTIQSQTQTEKLDRRKRQRKARQGKRMVVLAALGFWNDGSGGLGKALALVYGLTVLDQRCLFHKLRNVADKARSELEGGEKRDSRQQLLEQSSTIYQAESAAQARERLARWAENWREHTPKAVATLERDFEQTLVYYSLESIAREWIRTTSL
jgi:hypothetical protein